MKTLVGILIAMALVFDPGKIGKINSVKSEAKAAFLAGDYKTAIAKYKYLVDSLGVTEDEVAMNLAHAYFKSKDTANAFNAYQPLTQSKDDRIKSLANQQLGVLTNQQGKLEDALSYFKQALKAAPANEDARFNYEMVKKKLEEQKKKEQEQQDKQNKDNKDQKKDKKDQKDQKDKDQKKDDQQKDKDKKDQQDKKDQKDKKDQSEKDKQDQEKKDQEQKQKDDAAKDDKKKDKKDIPPSVSEKLKDMQMSEEKAKMILEAMKNQEMQYLQQHKRKSTKPKEKGKPDW